MKGCFELWEISASMGIKTELLNPVLLYCFLEPWAVWGRLLQSPPLLCQIAKKKLGWEWLTVPAYFFNIVFKFICGVFFILFCHMSIVSDKTTSSCFNPTGVTSAAMFPSCRLSYRTNSEWDQRTLTTSLAKYHALPPLLQTKYLFHMRAPSNLFL